MNEYDIHKNEHRACQVYLFLQVKFIYCRNNEMMLKVEDEMVATFINLRQYLVLVKLLPNKIITAARAMLML